jgi:hypothetical protein
MPRPAPTDPVVPSETTSPDPVQSAAPPAVVEPPPPPGPGSWRWDETAGRYVPLTEKEA